MISVIHSSQHNVLPISLSHNTHTHSHMYVDKKLRRSYLNWNTGAEACWPNWKFAVGANAAAAEVYR